MAIQNVDAFTTKHAVVVAVKILVVFTTKLAFEVAVQNVIGFTIKHAVVVAV